MSRRGRFQYTLSPQRLRRGFVVALTLLLLLTSTVQHALDSYARALSDRHAQQAATALAAPVPVNTLPATEPLTQIAPPSPSGQAQSDLEWKPTAHCL